MPQKQIPKEQVKEFLDTLPIKKRPKLFYDMEMHKQCFLRFNTGKQFVGHGDLYPAAQFQRPISIQYGFNTGKIVNEFIDETNATDKLTEFRNIIEEVQNQQGIVIGKNSDRFDNKQLNMLFLMYDVKPLPDWMKYTDDLEVQLRRHFYAPSYSLDYWSTLLKLGGKVPMDGSDWTNLYAYRQMQDIVRRQGHEAAKKISEYLTGEDIDTVYAQGRKAERKFERYGPKDVRDTRDIWNYCEAHLHPKFDSATINYARDGDRPRCPTCTSVKTHIHGYRTTSSGSILARFRCGNRNCVRYNMVCGQATVKKNGTFGPLKTQLPR